MTEEDVFARRSRAAIEIQAGLPSSCRLVSDLSQRHYRGHRERRQLKGYGLTASQRWNAALADTRWRQMTRPISRKERLGSYSSESGASPASSPSRGMWRKAVHVAKAAQHDGADDSSESEDGEYFDDGDVGEEQREQRREEMQRKRKERAEYAKAMDMQYFLEMVDLKHRHGSNLRIYHDVWKQADTHENFFYWLDYGEGKYVDHSLCNRERLEREKVRYLSREERQAYLVEIDNEGRLCWAKNGERIDTTEEYTDSKHGIVPLGDPSAYCDETRHGHDTTLWPASSAPCSPPPSPPGEEEHHIDTRMGGRRHSRLDASPVTILNHLLRKAVQKNTWIFVADISFRLYVGIKQSGAFQHSSFLHGARVSAAGLITIKDGKLKSLSPLSGHYKPYARDFRKFIHALKDEGADMSGIATSKSYAIMLGLETWAEMKKGKRKIKGKTHEKQEIFQGTGGDRGEEEQRERNGFVIDMMQKFRIKPREPKVGPV